MADYEDDAPWWQKVIGFFAFCTVLGIIAFVLSTTTDFLISLIRIVYP